MLNLFQHLVFARGRFRNKFGMTKEKNMMHVGFIGLGKMGSRMVDKLTKEGHEALAWNRSEHPLKTANSIQDLIQKLNAPRVVWVMVPAGEATTEILAEVEKFVEKGDIIIDGGNAHFADTQKRYEAFAKKGIRYLGIGVSGGIIAAKNGYPLMVGGNRKAYDEIAPLLDSLASRGEDMNILEQAGQGIL
ncbi:MAG: NAD(P)-binding domain-containing protein [Patescibacteria group bacterium]